MYDFSSSAVRVDNTDSVKFSVKVGIHQGSVLGPLLFTMALETSREFRSCLLRAMLYADDLVIIGESLVEFEERYLTWKNNREQRSDSQYRKDRDNEVWHERRTCVCIR